jgi:hypothetical protein
MVNGLHILRMLQQPEIYPKIYVLHLPEENDVFVVRKPNYFLPETLIGTPKLLMTDLKSEHDQLG